jgi:YD repeat-containing protein
MEYHVYYYTEDALGYIIDEVGHNSQTPYKLVEYGYNNDRDRTSVKNYYDTSNYHENTYTYNNHDMTSRTDPIGNEWTYTYYSDHRLHTETDPYGNTKTYTYNSAGQLTQVDSPLDTHAVSHYDAYGRLDYSTDGQGKTTNYHYNEDGETRGFLTSVHDPDGNATLYHYDSKGRRDEVTDPSSNVTSFEYDDLDRVTKVTNPDSTTVETKYTCCHKSWVQNENGKRTYYVYDAKVRPYKTIASAKSTTLATSIYTDPLNPLNDAPANGGNLALTSVTDFPNSGKVVVLDEIISYTGRDTQNNLLTGITRGIDGTRKVDADSGYDVGRLDTTNGLDFVQATYGYDSQYLDWLISLTDARGNTTYYTYYANGNTETTWYPDNKGERYTYDNGNSGNNMIKKEYGTFSGTYPNQTLTVNNDLTVNYEYDGNNRLIRTYH